MVKLTEEEEKSIEMQVQWILEILRDFAFWLVYFGFIMLIIWLLS